MADTLRIKRRTSGAAGAPASLAVGELAFNEIDGGLYIGLSNSTVIRINSAGGGGGGAVSVSDTPPASPTSGQLWYESDTGILWVYYVDVDSSQWVAASGSGQGPQGPPGTGGGGASITISDTPPGSPTAGALWWESDTGILWIYYTDVNSSQWVAVNSTPAAASSGPVLLLKQTVSAVASVDFTGLLTSAYDEYEVHFYGVYSSSAGDSFGVRVGESGVYKTASTYDYASNSSTDSSTNVPNGSSAYAFVPLAYPANVSNSVAYGVGGKLTVRNPIDTANYKYMDFQSSHYATGGARISLVGMGGWIGDAGAIDSLRFMMNAGNITGTFKLYGIK